MIGGIRFDHFRAGRISTWKRSLTPSVRVLVRPLPVPSLPSLNHFKVREIELNPLVSFVFQESCRPRAPRGLRGRRKATKGEGRSGERKSRNQPVSQGYLPPERRPRPDCSDCPSSCSGRPSSDTGWLIQSKELYQTICESRRERGGKEERRERKGRTNERGT